MATNETVGKTGKRAEGWAGAPPAKQARNFRKIESDFVKFDEIGRSVEGTLIEVGEQKFANGSVGRYKIETDEGRVVSILGSQDLDDKLRQTEIGDIVRITLIGGTKTRSGQNMKLFDVEIAE